MAHKQLTLSTYQITLLRRHYGHLFSRLWDKLERRCATMSGEAKEAILHGICRYLLCRRAGRLLGYRLETRRGIRPYNLKEFFDTGITK